MGDDDSFDNEELVGRLVNEPDAKESFDDDNVSFVNEMLVGLVCESGTNEGDKELFEDDDFFDNEMLVGPERRLNDADRHGTGYGELGTSSAAEDTVPLIADVAMVPVVVAVVAVDIIVCRCDRMKGMSFPLTSKTRFGVYEALGPYLKVILSQRTLEASPYCCNRKCISRVLNSK